MKNIEIQNIIRNKFNEYHWNPKSIVNNFGLSYDFSNYKLLIIFDENLRIADDFYHLIIKNKYLPDINNVRYYKRGLVSKEDVVEISASSRRVLDQFSEELDKNQTLKTIRLVANGQSTSVGFDYTGNIALDNYEKVIDSLKVVWDESYKFMDKNNLFDV